MNVDSTKNKKLLKQYPFVGTILNSYRMEPTGVNNIHPGAPFNSLTIKVECADGDLMFRQAENTGLGDSSCIFSLKKDREGQVMRKGEYLFAVDNEGSILNRLNWPRNEKEEKDEPKVYGYHVLWGEKEGKFYTNPISDKVKFLVWVTVSAWHEDTRNDDAPESRFGKLIERQASVTVYRKPAEGFGKLQENSNVYENLYLKSRVLLSGALRQDFDYIRIDGMLAELAKFFQEEVFLNGLREMYDSFPTRGGSGTFGTVKIMASDLCGYHRIQLEDATCWISFQQHDSSKWMNALGMGGTLPQLRNLVKTFVKKWNESPDARLAFQSDSKISVM